MGAAAARSAGRLSAVFGAELRVTWNVVGECTGHRLQALRFVDLYRPGGARPGGAAWEGTGGGTASSVLSGTLVDQEPAVRYQF